jgi:BirA family biotin operon repressor/biotin-[acetyl-CoA-carboxylase] ligase
MRAELDLAEVEEGIAATEFAGRLTYLPTVDSTNRLALESASQGAQVGVWIADEQTAGRGRGGHHWHSAPGDGLYVSLLVTPRLPLHFARSLPIATGLAVQAAVEGTTGLALDLRWPNDLMFGEQKCGGILVESASDAAPAGWGAGQGAVLRYAVIGIGLNVNHMAFPSELAKLATSLALESGRQFEREPLLAAMLRQMDLEMKRLSEGWLGTDDGPGLFRRFTEASTWVSGKRVKVEEGGGYTGITRGLDDSGFLRVEDDAGVMRIVLSGGVRSA